MINQFSVATEVAQIIQAASTASALPLTVTPSVSPRVDINRELETSRRCMVMPAGFESTTSTRRGSDRFSTIYIDVAVYEPIPAGVDPSSPAAVAWMRKRYELIEAIDGLDYSGVDSAAFTNTELVTLNYESPAGDDDSIFFQVVRLTFSASV